MNTFPAPTRDRILLVIAPSWSDGLMLELITRLALRSAPFVIDGGNSFQGYELAALLRRRTPDYAAVLERTQLSRVFTCYQMLALLSEIASAPAAPEPPVSEPRAPLDRPVIVLDFLATFYDQSVPPADRARLLEGCIGRLRRLSRAAPLAVWARRRDLVPPEGLAFLARLRAAAGQVWAPEPPRPAAWKQGGLLDG